MGFRVGWSGIHVRGSGFRFQYFTVRGFRFIFLVSWFRIRGFGALRSGFGGSGFSRFGVSGLGFGVRDSGFSGFGVSRKGLVVFGVRGFAFKVFVVSHFGVSLSGFGVSRVSC